MLFLWKYGVPENFNFSFGETCWHTVYTTSIFFDESSQNFTLYVQFILAFIQTTTLWGNLPKKAEFVRNYSLHTAFISWEHLNTTCTEHSHRLIREQDILSKYAIRDEISWVKEENLKLNRTCAFKYTFEKWNQQHMDES